MVQYESGHKHTGNDDEFIKKIILEYALKDGFSMKLGFEEWTLTSLELGKEATDNNTSIKQGYKF